MPRVIVLDDIAPEGLQILDAADGIEYDIKTKLAGEELKNALAEYDGAICRSGVKITPESLEGNTRLKAIVRAGVGTDNIDKPAATRQGIVVMNTPTGNTLSTAEQAFALMLALSRNTAPANQSLIEGRWDRKKYMGAQLADKTIGIVGLGRIGLALAARANAFEMRVIGFDPFMTAERAKELNIELVESVKDMLPRIDYMSVHTPLNDATRNMIDDAEVEALKPGARLSTALVAVFTTRLRSRKVLKAANWAASHSTSTKTNRAPIAHCSACRMSCVPRTSGQAPKKHRRTWRSKPAIC